jgi:hypothetical protein
MDINLIGWLFSFLFIGLMLHNYKRLNSFRIFSFLVLFYVVIVLILKLSTDIKTRAFAPLIIFVIIYQPTRLIIRRIIKRDPIINLGGMTISDEEKEKMSIFDYGFAPFLFFTSIFFSCFYFWDRL